MVLSPHIVAGASLVSILTFNPFSAFFIGFISHFLLDAIPHWDYKIKSISRGESKMDRNISFDKVFLFDLLKVGLDIFVGLIIISFFITFDNYQIFLWGAFGAIFPDFLQILYCKFKVEPLKSLQKFHTVFIHSDLFKERKFAGILTQVGIVFISIILLLF